MNKLLRPLLVVQPPPQRVFAVVEVGPTQFKVAVDDMIVSERLRGVHVNQRISLNRVLVMGSPAETQIGRPLLRNVTVIAAVEARSKLSLNPRAFCLAFPLFCGPHLGCHVGIVPNQGH